MSFRRDDFHNSRTYEADPPARGPGPLSSAIAWLKRQFDKLLQSGGLEPRQSAGSWLSNASKLIIGG